LTGIRLFSLFSLYPFGLAVEEDGKDIKAAKVGYFAKASPDIVLRM